MMSDEVADPVEAGVQGQDEGLANLAARAVSAYRAGDGEPLARLVHDVTPLLWRTVRAQGADLEQAQDVVQNVWLTLVRDIDTIRDPHATLQWLLVTARRAAWRAVRRTRDDLARTSQDAQVSEWLAAPGEQGPDVLLARDERDQALWRHVRNLPERCRHLLALIAMVDRPDYAVVSRSLGMPVGSIGPTRGRCLAKLRLALMADPSWTVL